MIDNTNNDLGFIEEPKSEAEFKKNITIVKQRLSTANEKYELAKKNKQPINKIKAKEEVDSLKCLLKGEKARLEQFVMKKINYNLSRTDDLKINLSNQLDSFIEENSKPKRKADDITAQMRQLFDSVLKEEDYAKLGKVSYEKAAAFLNGAFGFGMTADDVRKVLGHKLKQYKTKKGTKDINKGQVAAPNHDKKTQGNQPQQQQRMQQQRPQQQRPQQHTIVQPDSAEAAAKRAVISKAKGEA